MEINDKDCKWMKFLGWEGDVAWFRKATFLEILKMKFRDLYTNKPDMNNLLIWMPPGHIRNKRDERPYKDGGREYGKDRRDTKQVKNEETRISKSKKRLRYNNTEHEIQCGSKKGNASRDRSINKRVSST